MKRKFALISTFDKSDLNTLCKTLYKYNISIISTGSTAEHIKGLGYKCDLVSDLTSFKEILDGRVKTMHPKIHASLLYQRSKQSHVSAFKKLSFPTIDFLIVNLYPFDLAVKSNKSNLKCIEMIDIGGPALLRSSAKNFNFVTTIPDPSYYKKLINNLNKFKGSTSINFRKLMAQKVFEITYKYDLTINKWLTNKKDIDYTDTLHHEKLRYGENPNQKASVYYSKNKQSIFNNKVQGKKLSYNNILDADAAINCVNEFSENACVIIKHNNPCGVALGKNSQEAFKKALECDPVSAYGGIVCFNRSIDNNLASILKNHFFEIIISKKFSKTSIKILALRKNLILINNEKIKIDKTHEIKSINDGFLKQEKNLNTISTKDIRCVSYKKANTKQLKDLIFALKVSKHVKSNAIVLVKNTQTVGIGVGQMSRIDSTKIAIKKNISDSFVAASDAFFPFNDNVKLLIKNKCKSIVQPFGSKNDKNIINLVNNKKISLYFYKNRLFKH